MLFVLSTFLDGDNTSLFPPLLLFFHFTCKTVYKHRGLEQLIIQLSS